MYLIQPNGTQFTVSKNSRNITTGSLEVCQSFVFFNRYICNRLVVDTVSPFHPDYEEVNRQAHAAWSRMTDEQKAEMLPVGFLIPD